MSANRNARVLIVPKFETERIASSYPTGASACRPGRVVGMRSAECSGRRARTPLRLSLLIPGLVLSLAATMVARESGNGFEPDVFQSMLTIEPTLRQVATMPRAPAQWRLSAATTARFDEVLEAEGYGEALAAALRGRLTTEAGKAQGTIVPDAALLDLFSPEERLGWWTVLAGHPANRSYRWPIAVRSSLLDELSADPEFAVAAGRIRSWGIVDGAQVKFGDLFALEDAFATEDVRLRFFRRLLGTETIFAKVRTGGLDAAASDGLANFWQAAGRSRDVESILSAARRIEGHDRLDVAHLLPRLPRSLLYTFPPDFSVLGEPPVENAAAAISFFVTEEDTRVALTGGFSMWLAANCTEVRGDRQFGDIIVFEDPARTRWPFSMVYIADGVLFGRPPTINGPWVLLHETGIADLNRRLSGNPVRTYRRHQVFMEREEPATGPVDERSDLALPAVELKDLPPGPWGTLRYYEVRLAPSTELLEILPVPESRPKWVFGGVTAERISEVIRACNLPEDVRTDLEALFARARPDKDGMITVYPPVELVFATPAEFRTRLFPFLRHSIEATEYAQSVTVATRMDPEAWFSAGLIPEPLRRTVLDLVYRRGDGLAISDYGALYHATTDPWQRRDMLKFIYQSPVLVVLLERPRPAEVPGLTDYWRLDQQKSVGRLLESFAGRSDVAYLDVVHLLPPVARELMNVYMRAPSDAPTPSCYWTALNFGAERPDPRLLITPRVPGSQHALVLKKLKEDYVRVEPPLQLGDVIMYRRLSDGEVRHLCSYVAADIVYTKNGFGSSSPWCLMHWADVDALYFQPETVERLTFRQKAPSSPVSR